MFRRKALVFILLGVFQVFAFGETCNFLSPFKKPLWSLAKVSRESKEIDSVKTVLYVSHAPYSPWFYLGAFYAFESYGVKIDSVVGNSFGVYIASLWKSGFALDDIQRLLKDPKVFNSINEDLNEKNKWEYFKIPFAKESKAVALQARLALSGDSSGVTFRNLPTDLNETSLSKIHYQLRLEEFLYRKSISEQISVVDCEGNVLHSPEALLKTLPQKENSISAGCVLPLPSETSEKEFSIILSAMPRRFVGDKNSLAYKEFLFQDREFSYVKNSYLTIRPHLMQSNSPEEWMQSGFSEVEKKISEIAKVKKLKPYETLSDSIQPWFRLTPALDSVPSELQEHLISHWNFEENGLTVADEFAKKILESSVYDSLTMTMQKNGNLQIDVQSPLVLDLQFGGFGTSEFGAFAFADFRFRYVNQFEYELGTNFFYGMGGFGVSPEFKLLRLLQGKMDFVVGYDYRDIKTLQSYQNDISYENRIEEEWRSDVLFRLIYHIDGLRQISLQALVGKREYQLDSKIFKERISTKPLSPELSFEQNKTGENPFFAKEGIFVKTALGLESVGAVFGEGETVPIFWKLNGNASFAYSPVPFFTFGMGAFAGANIYQEDGKTYPTAFGFQAIDNTIRQQILATPFGTFYAMPEFLSHHYLALNARFGFHVGNLSAWVFGSFVRDFEEAKITHLENSRLVLEPVLRYAYKSFDISIGMTHTVDFDSPRDLTELSDYRYFIQVGQFVF